MAVYFCIRLERFHPELASLAEACLRFTPDVALREGAPSAIFLEVSRCLALYSEKSLEKRITVLLGEWGLAKDEYRISRATSLPRAWISANQNVPNEKIGSIAITAIGDLMDPLGVRREERPKIRAMVEILFALGIRRIESLKKLPRDSAASRFGVHYDQLIESLNEVDVAMFERFRPTEKFSERIDLEASEPIWDLEPVLFHAKNLIDRVLKRAYGRGKALLEIELRLECERRSRSLESFSTTKLRFTFPQNSSVTILRSLREKLSHEFQKKPLEAPILALELEALELAPRSSAQTSFQGVEEARAEEVAEGFRDLVSELSTKLEAGKEVFQAELKEVWRPERSWGRVLKEPTRLVPLSLPVPKRPLHLLNPAEPLKRLGRYFFWGETRYAIREISQTERLSGEWWEEDGGFTRTYYRVKVEVDQAGEGVSDLEKEFWIYREVLATGRSVGIFLHGVF